MTQVPLPTGFQGLDDQPRLRENLINLFFTGSGLIRTPSLNLFASGRGVCRGAGLFQEEAYFASGTRLIKVEADGNVIDIGEIGGGTVVRMAATANELVLVSTGGDGYVWDGTTLTQIVTNFVTSVDVAILNQRAFFVPADGGPVFFSEVNDLGNIMAGSFIDAQLLPDKNIGIINYRNNLYVLGAQSGEVFRPTTNPDIPIQRDESASVYDAGYVAGRVLFADTFAFLGRLRNGSYGFHTMGQGRAPRVSNPAVEEILNEQYTLEELEQCVGMRYKWKGYEVLSFSLSRHTFCYSSGNWFFQESFINGGNPKASWRGLHLLNAYGVYLIGDKFGQNIGTMVDGKQDYGEDIEREIVTFVRSPRDDYFSIATLTWDCLVGTGSDETDTIGISVSQDGIVYGPQINIGLGDLGNYRKQIRWVIPGGLGTYENFMGLRTRVTAPVDFAADALQVD
ncbi:MAG: packaged DNA stabilization protein [Nitrosomonadaceae bacterium]